VYEVQKRYKVYSVTKSNALHIFLNFEFIYGENPKQADFIRQNYPMEFKTRKLLTVVFQCIRCCQKLMKWKFRALLFQLVQ